MLFFKKIIAIILLVLFLFTVVGCKSDNQDLSISYLGDTYNNKKVLYIDNINKPLVGFQYSSNQVTIFPNVKKFFDNHENEDVYFAVGVLVPRYPESYVLDFKYKEKTLDEYNSELLELDRAFQELYTIRQVYYTINYKLYGTFSIEESIDYKWIEEFGEIKYTFNKVIYTVDKSSLLKFVKDNVFYLDLLREEEIEIEEKILNLKDTIDDYEYVQNLAVLEKHTDYFKSQGFPTTIISPNNKENSFIVIYVQNLDQLNTFKPYAGFKYYFSMVGKNVYDEGFNWDYQI